VPHVDERLNAYYDGELPEQARRQVEAHLEQCPACRAKQAQLEQLSAWLGEVQPPDTLTAAETFRAQVLLRLPRRPERARYPSWAWHVVPLTLLSGCAILYAWIVCFSSLGALLHLAEWLGIDMRLSPSSLTGWMGPGTALGAVVADLSPLLDVGYMAVLYLALVLVFASYVGWVGTLWRATRRDRS
jgi:predicted anti-sigma-YlaC factor YlaD